MANSLDYSTLTVSNTALVLKDNATPEMPKFAHGAIITVEDDQVRYREDGTAPTSTEGILLNSGDVLNYDSWTTGVNWRNLLRKVQFIRVTNDAKLKIHWYD